MVGRRTGSLPFGSLKLRESDGHSTVWFGFFSFFFHRSFVQNRVTGQEVYIGDRNSLESLEKEYISSVWLSEGGLSRLLEDRVMSGGVNHIDRCSGIGLSELQR